MRSHKLTYSRQVALPDWLYTFQHQIASGGKDKRPDRLLPTAIIEDIAAVARGILEGHGTMRREHWDSLLEDADRCHATLGPRAKQVLQPAWAAARSEFLAARPARQAQTTMPAAQRLATAASQLRSRLADAPVRQACWDDARAAHEDETEHPETSELRIRLLGDAVTAAGHDWHRVSDILARAINDEPSALRALGWRDADRTPPNEQAGLALEDRVTICRNGLGRPAEQAELIAWVGFEDASIGAAVNLTAGAVQMWDIRELWLRYHEKRFDELPAELAGTRLSDPTVRLHDTPDTSGVLLRFPLGIGTTAHAVQRARDVGQALVALAVGSSTWRMMDGAAIVRDERIVSGQIRTSDTPAPLRDHYAQRDRTAEHLTNLDPAILAKALQRQPELEEIAHDASWLFSLNRIPDQAQRCAPAVRLLERRLPAAPDGAGWVARAEHWLRHIWARQRFVQDAQDAAFEGVYGLEEPWHPAHEHFDEFKRRVLPDVEGGRFRFEVDALIDALPELVAFHQRHEMSRRILRAARTHTATGAAINARIDEFGNAFTVLLRRASRVRNAAVHGNDLSEGTVASVTDFVLDLCEMVVDNQLAALRSGAPLATRLAEARVADETARHAVAAGARLGDAWTRSGKK
jgi:hypothetical protein